jgi:phosphoribosylamine-glycine ligase
MNIHEYQAKDLYRQYGVPTSKGFPAFTVDEAVEAAKKLPGPIWVVKAQIHAGGRGKGFAAADRRRRAARCRRRGRRSPARCEQHPRHGADRRGRTGGEAALR